MLFVLDCGCTVGVQEITSARDKKLSRRVMYLDLACCPDHVDHDITIEHQAVTIRPFAQAKGEKEND